MTGHCSDVQSIRASEYIPKEVLQGAGEDDPGKTDSDFYVLSQAFMALHEAQISHVDSELMKKGRNSCGISEKVTRVFGFQGINKLLNCSFL